MCVPPTVSGHLWFPPVPPQGSSPQQVTCHVQRAHSDLGIETRGVPTGSRKFYLRRVTCDIWNCGQAGGTALQGIDSDGAVAVVDSTGDHVRVCSGRVCLCARWGGQGVQTPTRD